jgi:hypothetical protein
MTSLVMILTASQKMGGKAGWVILIKNSCFFEYPYLTCKLYELNS